MKSTMKSTKEIELSTGFIVVLLWFLTHFVTFPATLYHCGRKDKRLSFSIVM